MLSTANSLDKKSLISWYIRCGIENYHTIFSYISINIKNDTLVVERMFSFIYYFFPPGCHFFIEGKEARVRNSYPFHHDNIKGICKNQPTCSKPSFYTNYIISQAQKKMGETKAERARTQ